MHTASIAYLGHLRLKRCTQATIRGRRLFLARLEDDLGLAPVVASADQVEAWYASLPARMTARSQATMLTNARAFYRWAVSQGHRGDDPTQFLPRPRVTPGRPRPMDTADVLRCVEQSQGRIYAAIVGAAYAGMRAIEIAAAERSWLTEGGLVIVGKGGRSRVVPIHPLIPTAFAATDGDRLFPSPAHPGEVASAGLVSKKVNRWLHDVVDIDESLHSLRHWHATQLYRSTRDLRLVQDILGHASPQTTSVYADYFRPDATAAVTSLPTAS